MHNVGNQDKVVNDIIAVRERSGPNIKIAVVDTFSNPVYGLDEEELIGLNLVDRKRMRGDPEVYDVMDTVGDLRTVNLRVLTTLIMKLLFLVGIVLLPLQNFLLRLGTRLAIHYESLMLELSGIGEFPDSSYFRGLSKDP